MNRCGRIFFSPDGFLMHTVKKTFKLNTVFMQAKIAAERVKHWNELIAKHFNTSADLDIIILKGHLLIEQQITALICHECHSPELVTGIGLSFAQKTLLLKALVDLPYPEAYWKALVVINKLRNDLAHSLEPLKLGQHLKEAKTICKEMITSKMASPGNKPFDLSTDKAVVIYLIANINGFSIGIDCYKSVLKT